MNLSHAQFQAAFTDALFAPPERIHPDLRHLAEQPAFAVYRNTVMKGCIDALEANFPAVVRLVGSEWFRAAAAVHVVAEAPRDARMLAYGDRFVDFLGGFGPAAGLTYLPGVAQLDVLWRESHAAHDAPVLDGARLALADPASIGRQRAAPHPAARWLWFDELPVFSIWSRNRHGKDSEINPNEVVLFEPVWQGEGALLTRPGDAVHGCTIPKAGCAFLDACATGCALADAAEQALAIDPGLDLATLFDSLLRVGAFVGGTLPLDSPAGAS